MLDSLLREVRYAFRSLRREPAFVAGVVATFALSIGTNAAMLGLVTRLMLAPPPGIREAERITRVGLEHTAANGESYVMSSTSYPVFRALAEARRAFEGVAAVRLDTVAVGRGADLEQAAVVQASGSYFTTLGSSPARGRNFGPGDDELPAGNSVVVLSHAYWMRRFDGDPTAIGREMTLAGQPFTIIGVAARGFNGDNLAPVDLFMPLTASQRFRAAGWWNEDGLNLVSIVARLADGTTPATAQAAATTILRERAAGAAENGRIAARLDPLLPGQSSRQSPQAKIALWLSAVSLIVLLIATANVGILLLLRAARRRRDTAVRIALGAARGRIARQLLVESLLLAVVGAAAGVLLSRWFGDVVRLTLLPDLARDERFVDGRVLAVSVIVAAGAGLVAGLSPLVRLGRASVALDLHAGNAHGSSGRFTSQRILVGVQVALCTVLLVGAGLFVRSLQRVQSQDLGFATSGLLHVTLEFQGALPANERDLAHEEAVGRVRMAGGVDRATVVQAMPFGNFHVPPISVPGLAEPPSVGGQLPMMYGATPDYLAMMGVTLRQGRLFDDGDMRGGPLVVLVNESMARAAWPGESAIGKCVRAGYGDGFDMSSPGDGNPADATPCREVVGVVRDSRVRSLRPDGNEGKLMQYYVPFPQLPVAPVPDVPKVSGILVRVRGDVDRTAPAVRRAVQGESSTPVYARVVPYQDLIDPQLRSWRLGAVLFSAFSALALGIAAVGLFGVVSYLVAQRTREIGVRLALGASRRMVWGMVVRDAVRLVVAGIVVGGIAAMAAGPLVRDMLFQTSPWEPANLATAVAVLLGVTVVAAIWPAWRAGRVDPLTALRSDS